MMDPAASEPPFEILIYSGEPGASPAIPRVRPAETPVVSALKPERWLYVIHLLVLLSVAGLVICIVGFVRLSRSPSAPEEASAAVVRTPPPEPIDLSPKITGPIEPVQLALAPRPGAEGPAPAASTPQAAPPAPVAPEPEPEPAPPPPAPPPAPVEVKALAPEVVEARKLLEEAKSLESENPGLGAARYRKVIELLPERTELWKSVADLELARGSTDEAARAYRAYLKSHPDKADALQNLAILEMRAGRLDEARTCLEAAIKAAPSADLYYNLGNLQLKASNVDAAIASYRRALEYESRHAEARFNLALALERADRRAEAVAALAQLGPVSPEVARERARIEAMMGGLEAGRALGLARGSSDVEMVLGVASGFRQAGQLEKALALLDRAVELAPKLASARLNRGAVRQAMGQLTDAAADYEEAARLDPALPEARFNLGVLAEERGQYVTALDHYAAALKANPGMGCALNNIGALYLKVGQAEKAIEWFRKCRIASADFAPARLNLAWAYLAQGSKELALNELRLYTQDIPKDKRSPDAARVMAELGERTKNSE